MSEAPVEKIEHADETDLTKVREMCSKIGIILFEIMGRLEEIRDVVDAIQIPKLSSYVHVSKLPTIPTSDKGVNKEEKQLQPKVEVKTFVPEKKKAGNPLEELQHNMKNMNSSQLQQLLNKLATKE